MAARRHPRPADPDRAPALVRALDVATSGVLVCDAAPPSRAARPGITYVNGAFERLFGRSAATSCSAATSARSWPSEAADAEDRRALGARAARRGRPRGDVDARRRDGSAFRAEMKITPVRDGDGTPTDWIAVVDDVTERLDALDALALAEARYRELVEYVPAVAYVAEWDEHSTLTYVSPQIEGLLGWPPEAFLDDQDLWYRCIHPDDVARVGSTRRAPTPTARASTSSSGCCRRDGREVWVRDKETVIRDADGAPRVQPGRPGRRHADARDRVRAAPTSATARSATSTSPARSS